MKTILFVSHDANRAGAQRLLFDIMLSLKEKNFNIVLLLIDEWGDLKPEFEKSFPTYVLHSKPKGMFSFFSKKENDILNKIKKAHPIDLIYANTIATCEYLELLKNQFNCKIISHIHELGYSIKEYGTKKALENLKVYADTIVACSESVKINLTESDNIDESKIEVIHSFINNQKILKIQDQPHSKSDYFINSNFMVGSCGNADWRKAPDIFLLIAKKVVSVNNSIKFVWIGVDKKQELYNKLQYDLKKLGLEENVVWVEKTAKSIELINAIDVFLLCSREDPFPLVMLEAAMCKKPIVAFKKTGGAEEFIENDNGILCDYLAIDEMAQQILNLEKSPELATKIGDNAQKAVLEKYNFEVSINKIHQVVLNNLAHR